MKWILRPATANFRDKKPTGRIWPEKKDVGPEEFFRDAGSLVGRKLSAGMEGYRVDVSGREKARGWKNSSGMQAFWPGESFQRVMEGYRVNMESRIEVWHELQPVKKESADSIQVEKTINAPEAEKPADASQTETFADASQKETWYSRTALLLGEEGVELLRRAKVAVFGVGGVGGFVVEALARCGVGAFVLVDNDTVCFSNLNRQIIATTKTIGREKVEVMRERILEINPQAQVEVRKCFFLPETAREFDFSEYSYVVDAVDTVTAKLEIILRAQAAGVPVISSMGAGNKLDPTAFCVADIYQTSVCPLAKVMRRELKKRGVKKLKVVYSKEPPIKPQSGRKSQSAAADRSGYEGKSECTMQTMTGFGSAEEARMAAGQESTEKARAAAGQESTEEARMAAGQESTEKARAAAGQESAEEAWAETTTAPEHVHARRSTPGSVAFVPSVAGLIVASEVVKDLLSEMRLI